MRGIREVPGPAPALPGLPRPHVRPRPAPWPSALAPLPAGWSGSWPFLGVSLLLGSRDALAAAAEERAGRRPRPSVRSHHDGKVTAPASPVRELLVSGRLPRCT